MNCPSYSRANSPFRRLCYSFAMISKAFVLCAVLLAIPVSGQTASEPAAKPQPPSSSSTPAPGVPPAKTDCLNGPCDYQPAHITVATPAPARAPWTVQDRIAWIANVLLALLGYVGIMMAISTLKKIERQSKFFEVAAEAAAKTAEAAEKTALATLAHVRAMVNAERPWVLITIVPSRSIENGFTVIATNRGRSPAQVVAASDETLLASDEAQLPAVPEYKPQDANSPFVSIILLPGEFMNLKSFSRDDVRAVCENEERFRRIENWEERIFLYGKIVYRDLAAPPDEPAHETGWCCRYIHGRQKSGLVMAGSQEYNLHT